MKKHVKSTKNISENKMTAKRRSVGRSGRKHRTDYMKPVCWIVIPAITFVFILLDALRIYSFNAERLIVLGIALLVVLLPFFSEITIKDLSVKRNRSKSDNT